MKKVTIVRVPIKEARRFMIDCLKAVGADKVPAEQQADVMIQADRRGHHSHGMNRLDISHINTTKRSNDPSKQREKYRLEQDKAREKYWDLWKNTPKSRGTKTEMYVNDIEWKLCEPNNKPKIVKEGVSTVLVNAMNCLGATSGHFCMDIAIKKAKETGLGWVSAHGANHFGRAGYWARKAAEADFIGMAFSNTSPLMAPTRSKRAALGTNPISVVAPGLNGDIFYVDISTTVVCIGTIEMRHRRGVKLAVDWALGPDGKETRDPEVALKTRLLMPLGGGEMNSGYKGYGLAGAVEILCGICSGSNYGHKIRTWGDKNVKSPANLGQCFAALDYKTLAPGFQDRLTECLNYWRNLEPADPKLPVLAPGDKEKAYAKEIDRLGTIPYVTHQINTCTNLAERLKVKPLSFTK